MILKYFKGFGVCVWVVFFAGWGFGEGAKAFLRLDSFGRVVVEFLFFNVFCGSSREFWWVVLGCFRCFCLIYMQMSVRCWNLRVSVGM